MKKYGYENFKYTVLHKDIQSQDEMNMLEEAEVNNRKTIYPNGYNLMQGGGSKGSPCRASLIKMSESGKERAKLHPASNLVREKISKALLGRGKTPEHIEKVRQSLIGRKRTDQQKINIKNAHACRRIPILCVETRVIYRSMDEASAATGASRGCISLAVAGKRITAGGLHWARYGENLDDEAMSKINRKSRNDIIRMAVICVETGEEFASATQACRKYKTTGVARACKHINYTAAGFHWRRKDAT